MPAPNLEDAAKYLYEIGQLKRVRRSGWWIAGIDHPESVAEHSFRTAVIGYVLAHLAGADLHKVATMCLFHDAHETRLNDVHRIARRYLPWGDAGERAAADQAARLPESAAKELTDFFRSWESPDSLEAQLARDADQLECLVQAREYQAQGHKDVQDWIDGCRAALKTDVAQALADECLRLEPSAWWQGLKVGKATG